MNGEDALKLCEAMAAAETKPARKEALDGFAMVLRRVISNEITKKLHVRICSACGNAAEVRKA